MRLIRADYDHVPQHWQLRTQLVDESCMGFICDQHHRLRIPQHMAGVMDAIIRIHRDHHRPVGHDCQPGEHELGTISEHYRHPFGCGYPLTEICGEGLTEVKELPVADDQSVLEYHRR